MDEKSHWKQRNIIFPSESIFILDESRDLILTIYNYTYCIIYSP